MNYKELAPKIVELVGGVENVETLIHCMTRLRFTLKDESKAQDDAIRGLEEVQGVVKQGGMYQVIIGTSVEQLYVEILPYLPSVASTAKTEQNTEKTDKKKEKLMNRIFSFISGSITPSLPVLIGSGLISAILALLTNFNVVSAEDSTYVLLNTLAQSAFNYLPVLVAFSAAKRLKTNEYLAAFIMLALCSGTISGKEGLTLFGISLTTVTYTSNIVPALLMVPVMAQLDKLLIKYTPEALKSTLRPFVLAIVTFPLTLLILGPIGTWCGTILAEFCIWVTSFGGISMAVLSALHPLLVMVGMHTIITPLIVNEIATYGSSLLFSKALAANLAIAGAALAVGLKAKKQENKESGISTGITACLSVTEPALYGVLVRLKKPLIGAIIASGITGLFIGFFDIRAFATASCSFLTLPIYMGGDMANFYLACVAAVIALALGFVCTWFIGFDED